MFCGNPGCSKRVFDLENSPDDVCEAHNVAPIFHDRKKLWPCCKQEAWDWDDFQKLRPCTVAKHTPKYK